MALLPADLGARWMLLVLRKRLMQSNIQNAALPPFSVPKEGSRTPLRRWMMHKADIAPELENAVYHLMRPMMRGFIGGFIGGGTGFLAPAILGFVFHQPGLAIPMLLGWVAFASIGLFAPRHLIAKYCNTPLSADEVEMLRKETADPLELAYLDLVREATTQNLDATDTAGDLREAIRTLGEALTTLPQNSSPLPEDATALLREAHEARQKAGAESDPIVAASLLRRAEAQERSAQTIERSHQILRRAATLREELAAQTEALRLSVVAASRGEQVNVREVAQLAEAVQAVGKEADNIATARAELDATIASYPCRMPEEATESVLTVRH
jgi:hypothetical protein